MTIFHASIIVNIVLLVVLAYLALDRKNWNKRLEEFKKTMDTMIEQFKETCVLRHNPIDKAIQEIKGDLRRIWEKIDKMG